MPIARRAAGHVLTKMATEGTAVPLYPKPKDEEEKALFEAEGRTPLYTLRVLTDGLGQCCVQAKDAVRVLAVSLLKAEGRRRPRERLARGSSWLEGRVAKVHAQAEAERKADGQETAEDETTDESAESKPIAEEFKARDMPEEFKPIAAQGRVSAADVDLELTFVVGDQPFRFQVHGEKWFTPTLALFTPKYFALNTKARVWWDTRGGVLKIAFPKSRDAECSWESELRLLGIPIPFRLQDILVPWLIRFALGCYSVRSPLTVDLKKPEEIVDLEEEAVPED